MRSGGKENVIHYIISRTRGAKKSDSLLRLLRGKLSRSLVRKRSAFVCKEEGEMGRKMSRIAQERESDRWCRRRRRKRRAVLRVSQEPRRSEAKIGIQPPNLRYFGGVVALKRTVDTCKPTASLRPRKFPQSLTILAMHDRYTRRVNREKPRANEADVITKFPVSCPSLPSMPFINKFMRLHSQIRVCL